MGESDHLYDDDHRVTTGSAMVRGFIPEMVFYTSFDFSSLINTDVTPPRRRQDRKLILELREARRSEILGKLVSLRLVSIVDITLRGDAGY